MHTFRGTVIDTGIMESPATRASLDTSQCITSRTRLGYKQAPQCAREALKGSPGAACERKHEQHEIVSRCNESHIPAVKKGAALELTSSTRMALSPYRT